MKRARQRLSTGCWRMARYARNSAHPQCVWRKPNLPGKAMRGGWQELSRPRSKILVGATRFELATPCTPCKCATRLRHAPTEGTHHSANVRPALAPKLAAQDLDQLLEFEAHLMDQL